MLGPCRVASLPDWQAPGGVQGGRVARGRPGRHFRKTAEFAVDKVGVEALKCIYKRLEKDKYISKSA